MVAAEAAANALAKAWRKRLEEAQLGVSALGVDEGYVVIPSHRWKSNSPLN